MATAPKPGYKVIYNGVNISQDISRHIITLEYRDKVAGEADEISITLDDATARWRNDWYPSKGDTINVEISDGVTSFPCGQFKIDEIELQGPPDTISIRAVSAFITKKLKTKRSKANENLTLSQLAANVAARHGFTVTGKIDSILLGRTTQHREGDLEYLSRVAAEYGYVFSVKGTQMVFTNVFDLEASDVSFVINRRDLKSYKVKDKAGDTYADVTVKYHNPQTNKLIQKNYSDQAVKNPDGVAFTEITAGDTLTVYSRVENQQQADVKAKAALHKKNSLQQEGYISLPGNILMLSGNNFTLTGMGALSGKYHILDTTHKLDKSGGYDCDGNIKRLAVVAKNKQVTTAAKKNVFPVRGNKPVPFASEIAGLEKPNRFTNNF